MGDYFCGWYFKCQSRQQTLAVIPAFHKSGRETACSIQLITNENSWNLRFPGSSFQKNRHCVTIAGNQFGKTGLRLDLHTPELTAAGILHFGPLSPIRYDIMGPFCCVPFLECRHSVLSMAHRVDGALQINGASYPFYNATGYLEEDRGRSFPTEYAWTQCSFPGGSLMLSVAEIPLGGIRFTGVIGVILWQNREYRLATYLGAKAVRIQNGEITVRQGRSSLTVRLLEQTAQPLCAPSCGAMTRTIHESAACRAAYCFQKNGRTLFSFASSQAAFEYEYRR